jgi:hypothetical protein
MREIRLSGSVEGVVSNHDPYSDSTRKNQFYSLGRLLVLDGLWRSLEVQGNNL